MRKDAPFRVPPLGGIGGFSRPAQRFNAPIPPRGGTLNVSARELAVRSGIAIHHAAWQVAAGQIIQFAECTRQPLQITLNDAAIERLATASVAEPERHWFTREQITEVILAHELFHLLTPAPSVWAKHNANEEAAHAFAQSWTGLPFHPTRYEQILWATFSA